MAELKLYKATSKSLKLILMSLLFVVIGVWLILKYDVGTTNYIMGWITICFFGLGIIIGFFQMFDRRPQIVINENGIWDRASKKNEIKWEQIIDSNPININEQKFISIITDETFIYKKKPHKLTTKFNKAVGAQKINIHLGGINIDENKLNELIHQLKDSKKKYRSIIITNFKINNKELYHLNLVKILLYIFISIALLLITLRGGVLVQTTLLIILGLGVFTARWYQGSSEKLKIKKYAEIITWFGLINMVLLLLTFETYNYVSKSVGIKLSTQIDNFKNHHSSYPTNIDLIMKKTDMNFIEKVFANNIKYEFDNNNYKLITIDLLNKKRIFNKNVGKWE